MKFKLKNRHYEEGVISLEEKEQMKLISRKKAQKEELEMLRGEENWLGPGKLHDIIRQQY